MATFPLVAIFNMPELRGSGRMKTALLRWFFTNKPWIVEHVCPSYSVQSPLYICKPPSAGAPLHASRALVCCSPVCSIMVTIAVLIWEAL